MGKKKLLVLLATLLFSSCTPRNTVVSSRTSSTSSSIVVNSSSLSKEESSFISVESILSEIESLSFSQTSNIENSSKVSSEQSISSEQATVSEQSSVAKELYIPTIAGYTNMIDKPSLVVHKLSDITALMDYYAFYYVDKFEFEIADDYQWYVGENNIDREMNAAYWAEEIVNGIMGMLHKRTGNIVEVTYVHYNRNSIELEKTLTNGNDLSYQEGNYNSNLTFSSDDATRKVVDVEDSQQLFYAVQHGYKINAKAGSSAERIYNKAKGILNKIISNDMTYIQKVYAIYDYIEHNMVYDYNAIGEDIPEPSDPQMLPDEYASPYQCYYLEGALDNNCCVCDGFAKAMSLLCNMAGLNCIRASGTSDTEWNTREVAGHAYNYVEYQNKWYLCCPTWGQFNNGAINYNYSAYLMTTTDWSSSFNRYASINLPEYVDLATYSKDFSTVQELRKQRFVEKTVTSNSTTYSCFITSMTDYNAIVDAIKANKASYATIYVDSESMYKNINNAYTKGIAKRAFDYSKGVISAYEFVVYNTSY